MNYDDGVKYMLDLHKDLEKRGLKTNSFSVGSLLITYPGRKSTGDYQLSEQGVVPRHIDVVQHIFDVTSKENFNRVVESLDNVYIKGLFAHNVIFDKSFVEKIYWITLQEEINYPQPGFAGRKLPFQRFFEAAVAKIRSIDISIIKQRTNNHGRIRPILFALEGIKLPSFYK